VAGNVGRNAMVVETDLAGFITAAFTEVCLKKEDRHPLEPTIAKYFHPDYHQWAGDKIIGYAEFVTQMRLLRGRLIGGKIEVLQAFRNGYEFADRHTIVQLRADGSEVRGEVYLFGKFAPDYRFLHLTEVSRLITDAETNAYTF